MKKFFSLVALQLFVVMAFAQTRPCPTIVFKDLFVVSSNGSTCTFRIDVRAQGDVGAQKALRVQAFLGDVSGAPLVDQCFVVPGSPSDSVYSTTTFDAPCTATITFIVTRYTSSNGSCQGGSCGPADTATGSGAPAPILLQSFNAKRNNTNVNLVWKTSFEQNVSEFIIQRRQGRDFVDIAHVPASNLVNGSSYNYTDMNVSKGVSEYRIKTIDLDAKYATSSIVAVRGTSDVNAFILYPNPTSGSAKITITDVVENTELQITDASGRIVKSMSLENTNSAVINGLQKGIYMVRLINKSTGDVVVKKLTVIN